MAFAGQLGLNPVSYFTGQVGAPGITGDSEGDNEASPLECNPAFPGPAANGGNGDEHCPNA